MRVERLNEAVKVRANFGGGIVTPLLFQRGSDTMQIVRVNARWADSRGQRRLHYFACTVSSGDVYELCLNSHDLTWKLTSVMLDG